MASVRLQSKNWELVATALRTELTRQHYLITKARHDILKLPIKFDKKGTSLASQVEEMKKTIFADCEYKEVHHDAEVQGNLNLEQLEELKEQLLDYESKIAEIENTIERLSKILYWVDEASKKQDTVFDKEMRIPVAKPLIDYPTFEDDDTEELKWLNTELI